MIDVQNLQLLTNKAAAHFEAGRYASAEKFYLRALKGAPKHPELLFTIATLYEEMGNPGKAVKLYRRALKNKPDYFAATLNLGACLNELGDHGEAETLFQKAVVLDPESHLAHFNLGNALSDQGKYDDAVTAFRLALKREPTLADGWFNLGNALRSAENINEAMLAYREAISLRPNFTAAIVNLGVAEQTAGRFDQARKSFETALAMDPALPAAHYQLSLMGQGLNGVADGITYIETLLKQDNIDRASQSTLHFAAARLCAKNKDYDTAFEHYRAANEIEATKNPFDVSTYEAYIDRLINAYTGPVLTQSRAWASKSEQPVFVIGMPRSGTTLVEQIIASHPLAFGAGERPEIVRFVRENVTPEQIDDLDPKSVNTFISHYLTVISKYAGAAHRITDKMPANFLNLGLISLMFPNAKIIHCKRNPLDTCLSCYFQNFSEGLSFSNDLTALGRYFRGYEKLMAHWEQVLPLEIHDVVYEDLVANLESESRSLIAHLGLDWDPACLEFFKTERQVTTASVWQARQPIYSSSLKTWQKYENHLGTLQDALNASD